MALNQFSRTQLLLGQESMDLLANATVAVFGIGGVGGYTVEALARSGVGHFVLVDDDKVCLTNINRQIIATRSSVGKYKVDVMKERILDINPKAEVEVYKCFYLPENADDFDFSKYSYVVDAVDTVTAKIEIIMRAKACNVPVISCMGAGNKLDPTKFRVADIYKTNMCPLAKVMRHELRKRGIPKLRQYRTKSVWRLCTPSACKFPVIFHKNAREYIKYSLRFLFHLTKNLTTHLSHNLCAVLPEEKPPATTGKEDTS